MPAGVRVLGPEGGPERVDARERQAVRLDVELARDGQEGGLAEEVLREVDGSVGRPGEVGEVEGRDAEQLAGALGIAGGQDRRVHPVEAVLVEVPVHRHGQRMADPGDRAERVRPDPQVGDLAKVFEGVPLGRDRVGVGVVDPADHLDRICGQLHGLPLALRRGDRAADRDGTAGGQVDDLVLVVGERRGRDHLEGIEAGSVVNGQEGEPGLRIAARADPALHGRARADRGPAREDVHDSVCLRHAVFSFGQWSTRGRPR